MLPKYRVQVRKQVGPAKPDESGDYVFRDLELPFPPVPGVVIDDLGGDRFTVEEVTWYEGQHRFVVYTEPYLEGPGASLDEKVFVELEDHGWHRNRRSEERTAA